MRRVIPYGGLFGAILAFLVVVVPSFGLRLDPAWPFVPVMVVLPVPFIRAMPLIPLFQIVLTAAFIHLIFTHQKLSGGLRLFGVVSYLFSFTMLLSAYSLQGVHGGSLCLVAAYYFYLTMRYRFTASTLVLAVLATPVVLPVVFAWLAYDVVIRKGSAKVFAIGTTIGVVLAFLLVSRLGTPFPFTDIVETNRTLDSLKMFLGGDWYLLLPFLYMLVFHRRVELLHILLLTMVVALQLVPDVRQVFFAFLVPFLALSLPYFVHAIRDRKGKQVLIGSLCVISAVGMGYSLLRYYASYYQVNALDSPEILIELVNKQKAPVISGVGDAAPLLAGLSRLPWEPTVRDYTRDMLVFAYMVRVDTELKGQKYVLKTVIPDASFDKDKLLKQCIQAGEYPVVSEFTFNRLVLYRCGQSR